MDGAACRHRTARIWAVGSVRRDCFYFFEVDNERLARYISERIGGVRCRSRDGLICCCRDGKLQNSSSSGRERGRELSDVNRPFLFVC